MESGKVTGHKTLCISAQVMEAGVDISFGAVIRLVWTVWSSPPDGATETEPPRLLRYRFYRVPTEIREGKQVTVALLDKFPREPKTLGGGPASEESIRWYYEQLFSGQTRGYQQYFEKDHGLLFDLLGTNEKNRKEDTPEDYTLCQAFKTAGDLFHVLDENTQDVLVPYGDGIPPEICHST